MTNRAALTRILAASILGSGAVFVEGTVVNVALPTIGRDLGLSLDGLQWIVDAYLLTLGSLILLGGALGDRYRRDRVFRAGAIGFGISSALCAFAPNATVLVLLRLGQGVTGALLVPNSLAMLEESFSGEARGTAVGRWSAGSAASTAIGPLAGGLILAAAGWRWVFALVAPFAFAAAIVLPAVNAPDRGRNTGPPIDYAGAALVTAGLGALIGALIAGPRRGFTDAWVVGGIAAGTVLLALFLVVERRSRHPLFDLTTLRLPRFVSANAATFLIYGALNVLLFLLMLVLQNALGYSALRAGASLLPVNALLFMFSSRLGGLAERVGARLPMTVGALVTGLGLVLFTRIGAGASYPRDVLPAVLVFGAGLATLVAPLTTAALESLGSRRAGLASGANNAVARLAGLVAVAAVPLAAGIGALHDLAGDRLLTGFHRAMWITAGLCAAAALVTWLGMPAGPGDPA